MEGTRETLIQGVVGMTGVGKTFTILHEIKMYCEKHPNRNVIIFDVNSEPQYEEWFPKTIALKDVKEFSSYKNGGVRRVMPLEDDNSWSTDMGKRSEIATRLTVDFRGGLLVLDDIDSYSRGAKTKKASAIFTTVRHSRIDLILIHQTFSPVTTIEWQNVTMFRVHKTTDSIDRYRSRIEDFRMIKIATMIVDEQYTLAEDKYEKKQISEDEYKKRRSFFVYVDIRKSKIIGNFGRECFERNCRKYILRYPADIKLKQLEIETKDRNVAISALMKELNMYFVKK